jgi:hypothetical protein
MKLLRMLSEGRPVSIQYNVGNTVFDAKGHYSGLSDEECLVLVNAPPDNEADELKPEFTTAVAIARYAVCSVYFHPSFVKLQASITVLSKDQTS